MNILYLHGLDSFLSDEKRAILEKFGKVHAPFINYREEENIMKRLLTEWQNTPPDVLIGSSLGGFMAYWLSLVFGKPALLFNPALGLKSLKKHELHIPYDRSTLLHVVMGFQDETLPPEKTLNWLKQKGRDQEVMKIHIISPMGHQTPPQILAEQAELFFEEIRAED